MSGESILVAGIRVVGFWRIFIEGGNWLYYIIVKQLGLRSASSLPVAMDIQSLVFSLILGIAVIAAAPALAQLVTGREAAGGS